MASQLMRTPEAQEALEAVRTGRSDPRNAGEIEAVLTGGLTMEKLSELVGDLRNEVPWRKESDIDCDYFDHRQLSKETLDQLEEWGLPPAMADIVHPTVSAVLGIQAQTRTDWQVDWGNEQSENVGRALGQKLADEERATRADRALSDAYAAQIKAGLGWVEVTRQQNPFAKSRYRVQEVHRREIWWDWRSKSPDLSDGRYKVRRQWYDVDFLKQLFPHLESVIEDSFGSYGGVLDDIINEGVIATDRFDASAWDRERQLTFEEEEWRDTTRRRAVIFEIWYRVWKRGVIARIGDRTIKLDTKNPRHVALIVAQKVQPQIAIYPEMRLSFWVGPHRVFDKPTPLPHDNDPYTPFWGFRADADKAPYGLIRGMRWPQDEVNTRLSKMLSLLTSKRVIFESTALNPKEMSLTELRREVSQHTSVIPLAQNGMEKFKIEDNAQLSQQQFSVYQEMKSLIAEVSNVYAPMLGKQEGGQSGVAINQLVEQGMTSLAEVNDNFLWAQREVGEQLLAFIMADSTQEETVVIGEKPTSREITLNKKAVDGNIENAVKYANVKVSLSEVPQTPTYRQRVFTMIAEAVKSMPPQMQAVMAPMMIEMSNLPGRKEAARFLRAQLGLPDPEAGSGEDPALAAAKQQYEPLIQDLQAQLQQAQQQMQQMGQELQDKKVDQVTKGREVLGKTVAEDRNSQAAVIEANARMVEARGKSEAELIRARAEAARPAPQEPAFDPKSLTDSLMKGLEQAVNIALGPVLKEVATLQGALQAMGERKPEPREKQEPPVINIHPAPVTIEKGAMEVNVTVDAKSKPVAKEISLPNGEKATITPKKE